MKTNGKIIGILALAAFAIVVTAVPAQANNGPIDRRNQLSENYRERNSSRPQSSSTVSVYRGYADQQPSYDRRNHLARNYASYNNQAGSGVAYSAPSSRSADRYVRIDQIPSHDRRNQLTDSYNQKRVDAYLAQGSVNSNGRG